MGENRVEISAIFDLETLDFEFEHFFESHEHTQRTADIMLALSSFLNGPNSLKK